ncbi:MAG: sulfatase-like hydrolase/transferase [Candidatus Aminicenantes bacterium]|nr:sulfatase-like hydrolase/transferase [Candidatus Aminicenantes bacterium]
MKIFIILFTIFVLMLSSEFNTDSEFERMNLLKNNKNCMELNQKSDSDKIFNYFHHIDTNTTCKGSMYKVQGLKKICIENELRGKIFISFSIKNFTEDKSSSIEFELVHLRKKDVLEVLSSGNISKKIDISKKINFLKGDSIILILKGQGKILLSDPIISTNVEKSYIFLISVDTLRADFLEVYGNTDEISNSITEFSKDCVIFDNCFSTSSWTLPAHISLFTGKNVSNHRVYNSNMSLSDKISVYPEVLAEQSFVFSINGGIFLDYKYGFFRGFDIYSSIKWEGLNFNAFQMESESEKMFDNSKLLIESLTASHIFAFLHTYQVHSPYQLHKDLKYSENNKKMKLPKMMKIPQGLRNRKGEGRASIFKSLSDYKSKAFKYLYKGEIEYFDHQFGKFIKYLKLKNIYNKSMIVFFSDHGEEFFDHHGWGHGHSLYNELIRIPLLIKFPDNKYKGTRVKANTSIIDIFPTLFDYMGLKTNINSDGISLMNLIRSNEIDKNRVIVSVLKYITSKKKGMGKFPQKIAVIWNRFKLIYNFKYSKELIEYYSSFPPPEYCEYELYDLNVDKHEKNNIVDNENHSNVFNYLKDKISRIKRNIFNKRGKTRIIKVSEKNKMKLKSLGYL